VTEWWPEPSIVFTSHGSREVRARRGRGDVTPDTVLVSEPAAEHDCLHPHGLDDRMLCVLFREDVDPGPALLVRHVPALHSLRRSLVAELRFAAPDGAEIDALGTAMLQAVRDVPATLGAAPQRRLTIGDCALRGAVFASIPITAVFARPAAGGLDHEPGIASWALPSHPGVDA
jgi:hypothetical protein